MNPFKKIVLVCLSVFSGIFGNPAVQAQDVKIITHRGCWISGIAPENNAHAVSMAARYGFKMIEYDVRKTSDGKIVIMHDATINRTMRNTEFHIRRRKECFCFTERDSLLLSDFNIDLGGNTNLMAEVTGNQTFEIFSTTATLSNGILKLAKNETFSKEWENRVEYGGIDIEVYYQGVIDIQLNGA
ncbi:hypothetical protein FACS1894181_14970 [Bacteroidia bacterium]|nr:hypothetical protein FACS1894181_14970 [Bacteroidia bacterium]